MELSLYRIFNALGDSIILSTYFKSLNVERVYYNRAEFDTLKYIMNMFNVQDIEFVNVANRCPLTMVDVVKELKDKKIKLLNPMENKDENGQYVTMQLASMHATASDRSIKLYEATSHNSYPDLQIKEVGNEKTIKDLFEILKYSKQHITIDSGTAWASVACGIDTTVISKNSYYFSDAYHYMKYLDTHSNVRIYQQHGLGIKIPNEFEFLAAAAANKIQAVPYQQYLENVK